jgi:GT2 family glycosyltransferase
VEQLAAIVLNYKRAEETLACVASVRKDAPDAAIIVIDNGSHQSDLLSEALPGEATLLRTEHNLGYAGGNNLGIRRALADGAQQILVLNSDVVVRRGCVRELVAALERHGDWGVAGPLSLLASNPETVDFISARVDVEHMALMAEGRDGPVEAVGYHDRESDYVTGSAMLFRRAALERVGLFDERFFLVWEDVDLCLRMRDAGWLCGATPAATVLHGRGTSFGGEISPLQRYFFARNSFLIVRKRLKRRRRWESEAFGIRRYMKWGRGRTPLHAAIRRGWHDGVLGRWGPAPKDLL